MDTRRNEKKRKERGASPARKWRGVGRARARVSGPFASNLWNEEVQNAQKFLSLFLTQLLLYRRRRSTLLSSALSVNRRSPRAVCLLSSMNLYRDRCTPSTKNRYIYINPCCFSFCLFFFFQNDARLPAALPRPHHSWMRVGSPALAMACLFGPFLLVRG